MSDALPQIVNSTLQLFGDAAIGGERGLALVRRDRFDWRPEPDPDVPRLHEPFVLPPGAVAPVDVGWNQGQSQGGGYHRRSPLEGLHLAGAGTGPLGEDDQTTPTFIEELLTGLDVGLELTLSRPALEGDQLEQQVRGRLRPEPEEIILRRHHGEVFKGPAARQHQGDDVQVTRVVAADDVRPIRKVLLSEHV